MEVFDLKQLLLFNWWAWTVMKKRRPFKYKHLKEVVRKFICKNVFQENWASSWDYGTYHMCDQRRLRRNLSKKNEPALEIMVRITYATSQSHHCLHTWSMEVDEGSDQKSDI